MQWLHHQIAHAIQHSLELVSKIFRIRARCQAVIRGIGYNDLAVLVEEINVFDLKHIGIALHILPGQVLSLVVFD